MFNSGDIRINSGDICFGFKQGVRNYNVSFAFVFFYLSICSVFLFHSIFRVTHIFVISSSHRML